MALVRLTKHNSNYYTLSKIYKCLLILTKPKRFVLQSITSRSISILIFTIICSDFFEI